MTRASKIRLFVLAGAVAATVGAIVTIPDRPAVAGASGDRDAAVVPWPQGYILIYDFNRKRWGSTILKRGGLLIFIVNRGPTRFACLGQRRFANFKRRLGAVRRLPSRNFTGHSHLARRQSLSLVWKGKGRSILGRKRNEGELPRPAKRLITRLTRLRHELRPGADRLSASERASAERLCGR